MGARPRARQWVAIVAGGALLVPPESGWLVAAQAPAAAAKPDLAVSVDGGWPRAYITPADATLIVYEPQIASWDARKELVAYAAVAYKAKGASQPTLGTVKLESRTSTSVADRLVRFSPVKVTETHFRDLPKEQLQDLAAEIATGIPEYERLIALDRVL